MTSPITIHPVSQAITIQPMTQRPSNLATFNDQDIQDLLWIEQQV
jgi:hypothetical protein